MKTERPTGAYQPLLENAGHIDLPIPEKLKDVLAQLHNRDDKKEDEN